MRFLEIVFFSLFVEYNINNSKCLTKDSDLKLRYLDNEPCLRRFTIDVLINDSKSFYYFLALSC